MLSEANVSSHCSFLYPPLLQVGKRGEYYLILEDLLLLLGVVGT